MDHDEHDGNRDDHEESDMSSNEPLGYGLRISSPLTPSAERAMTATIACAMAVHRALGPGFLESIYRRAMSLELEAKNLRFEVERPVRVPYRGIEIPGQRVDLIIENEIVVELKAVSRLDDVHRRQLVSYLRSAGLRGGLLINFNVSLLKHGIRRVVL